MPVAFALPRYVPMLESSEFSFASSCWSVPPLATTDASGESIAAAARLFARCETAAARTCVDRTNGKTAGIVSGATVPSGLDRKRETKRKIKRA